MSGSGFAFHLHAVQLHVHISTMPAFYLGADEYAEATFEDSIAPLSEAELNTMSSVVDFC